MAQKVTPQSLKTNTLPIIKIMVLALLVMLLVYLGYFILGFGLLESDIDRIQVIRPKDKPYKVVLYRNNGNATVQSGIQVRKSDGKSELTLKQYDRYDSVTSFSIQADSLRLVITNTNDLERERDTFFLKLP